MLLIRSIRNIKLLLAGIEFQLSFISIISLLAVFGCHRDDALQDETQLNQRANALYRQYLNTDLAQARQALLELVDAYDTNAVSPAAKTHGLWLTYSRLYALEARGGNTDLAEVYFAEARY